ncbi:hypothetical protein C8R47DRAFT_1095191 [Mycena vitilis]|nr:hypothetical protein C8R47DRAFT_1095191 [Mycena vitilis]
MSPRPCLQWLTLCSLQVPCIFPQYLIAQGVFPNLLARLSVDTSSCLVPFFMPRSLLPCCLLGLLRTYLILSFGLSSLVRGDTVCAPCVSSHKT